MRLPDKDHPVWIVLQGAISLATIVVTMAHGLDGGHTTGWQPDATDAPGAIGVAMFARLLWSMRGGKR